MGPLEVDLAVSLPEAGIEARRVKPEPLGEGRYLVADLVLVCAGRWAVRLHPPTPSTLGSARYCTARIG
jgi:hypothetical protein